MVDNFCFLRQLHLRSAVTYIQVSFLVFKLAFLPYRLFHHSGSLMALSTS